MAERAAIVTGASSGIGLAIATMLGEEGHGLTIAARRPDKLEDARPRGCARRAIEVEAVAGSLGDEEQLQQVVAAHRERLGRLDVLVNNAGVGIGQAAGEISAQAPRHAVGREPPLLRPLLPRALEMLRAARRRSTATRSSSTPPSIAGKSGQALAVGLLGDQARRGRLHGGDEQGAQRARASSRRALCPAFVDTPMTEFVKGQVAGRGR